MKNFKYLLTLLFLLAFSINAEALTIVYPKHADVTINSPTTFFVGNELTEKKLTINDEEVDLHKTGGFFHPVDLEYGVNTFIVSNGKDSVTYNITRENTENKNKNNFELVEYEKPEYFVTKVNNVPLRSTPINLGLNRLEHFQKGIPIKVVGEENEFYKVQLARDDYAWISKYYLEKATIQEPTTARIKKYIVTEDDFKRTYIYKLDKKVPYTLIPRASFKTNKELSSFDKQSTGYDLSIYNVKNFPENIYQEFIERTTRNFGYEAYINNENELIINIKKFPTIDKAMPLKNLVITIDPGHGGKESGAIGCLSNKEKDMNLQIAKKLKKQLMEAGAKVYMTRNDDSYVDLYDRVKYSKSKNTDIFISIHNNALADSAAKSERIGTSAYYYDIQSKELANSIHKELTTTLNLNDDKARRQSFAVIRNSSSIAVLIEVGYLIKPEDNEKIMNKEFQENVAKSIRQGMENYLINAQ